MTCSDCARQATVRIEGLPFCDGCEPEAQRYYTRLYGYPREAEPIEEEVPA